MIFKPKYKEKYVTDKFPNFVINGCLLNFVSQFRYFGHILSDNMNVLGVAPKVFIYTDYRVKTKYQSMASEPRGQRGLSIPPAMLKLQGQKYLFAPFVCLTNLSI